MNKNFYPLSKLCDHTMPEFHYSRTLHKNSYRTLHTVNSQLTFVVPHCYIHPTLDARYSKMAFYDTLNRDKTGLDDWIEAGALYRRQRLFINLLFLVNSYNITAYPLILLFKDGILGASYGTYNSFWETLDSARHEDLIIKQMRTGDK